MTFLLKRMTALLSYQSLPVFQNYVMKGGRCMVRLGRQRERMERIENVLLVRFLSMIKAALFMGTGLSPIAGNPNYRRIHCLATHLFHHAPFFLLKHILPKSHELLSTVNICEILLTPNYAFACKLKLATSTQNIQTLQLLEYFISYGWDKVLVLITEDKIGNYFFILVLPQLTISQLNKW